LIILNRRAKENYGKRKNFSKPLFVKNRTLSY